MGHCKYMLPCGMCDKYDIECKLLVTMASTNDEISNDELKDNNDSECEHNWYLRSNKFDEYEMCFVKTYECLKCGAINREVQGAVVFSRNKDECEHDWQYDGADINCPAEYYHCTKCGETKKVEVEAI